MAADNWAMLVESVRGRHGVPEPAMLHLRESETYKLAARQFACGASDRVAENLLVRAMMEQGLINNGR